jgi:hypothetical protein
MRLDDPEVRELLDRSMILRMASVSPKGQPLVRCLWFVCQRGKIHTFTGEATPTGRSISVHPDVVLLFDGERGAPSSRILRVRGRAAYRRELGVVARVLLGLGRKYLLTPPGLRNLLAHARRVPLTVRFYAGPGWKVRGQGLGVVTEIVPERLDLIPRSPGQGAS